MSNDEKGNLTLLKAAPEDQHKRICEQSKRFHEEYVDGKPIAGIATMIVYADGDAGYSFDFGGVYFTLLGVIEESKAAMRKHRDENS